MYSGELFKQLRFGENNMQPQLFGI